MPAVSELSLFTTEIKINPIASKEFALWQARFNEKVSSQKGFISLEVLNEKAVWFFVQRFHSESDLKAWKTSKEYKKLLNDIRPYLIDEVFEKAENSTDYKEVTEVFITEVNPDRVDSFRAWTAKIHQMESIFPGFKGMYVQSPQATGNKNWITLLRFDCEKNLNRWLESKEREEVLSETRSFVNCLENHTIVSPYSGWFSSLIVEGPRIAPLKQGMLVLLILFPIVMLEFKYFFPNLTHINLALATFLGNVISVSLITWPCMPTALKILRWWLIKPTRREHYLGFLLIFSLYLLEVVLFWNFIPPAP